MPWRWRKDDPRRKTHRFPVDNTKLTRQQVAWVRSILKLDRDERFAAGITKKPRSTPGIMQRIADHLGVSRWTIEAIDRGRRRKGIIRTYPLIHTPGDVHGKQRKKT